MNTKCAFVAISMSIALIGLQPRVALCGDLEFEQARKKLISSQQLGVMTDLKWDPKTGPVIPRVYVGKTFYTLPIDNKNAFFETLDLFLMAGGDKHIARIDIHDGYSGKRIGEWTPIRGTSLH